MEGIEAEQRRRYPRAFWHDFYYYYLNDLEVREDSCVQTWSSHYEERAIKSKK